jgi:excisionase family DNA binding protein
MLTTGDVANIFGVNPATILRWCRQGKIRTCGTGSHGKRLFRRSDVAAAYLERSIRRSLKNL